LALAVPLSRFTPRVGGGSAFFVRRHYRATISRVGCLIQTMKYHIANIVLLALLFTACSKHPPTAVSPKLTDLGVIEMSDGLPIHRDLGGDKTCIITPTVLTNGIRLAFIIEQTNSAGVVQTLATPVAERTGIGAIEVIVGDVAVKVTPKIKQ
jgi:hypothetical protein